MNEARLLARGLAVSRGRRQLFRDIDIELSSGDALHVTGANGSGKTTLLRILCGLTQADSGQVFWRGENYGQSPEPLHGELAYLSHHNALYGDLTARENLALAPALNPTPAAITGILNRLSLKAQADLPTRVLSQGQCRRIALCRVLLQQATLWVLDEPLNSLDSGSQTLLESLLDQHLENGGMAVLTTHQPLSLAGAGQILCLDSEVAG
ncbi:MAG: cytochrome c biogenesis heme-transporting ATPase CcmA [Gammaproteobacteria bacterium]|nr:cytochrome c biogenesis heme-transporting ATPase CcmA [Gammaproteobacteria bacterium]